MSDNSSKNNVLSVGEIVNKYFIQLSDAPDTAELQKRNAELSTKYQHASYEHIKAKRLHDRVQRQYAAQADEFTLEVAQEERRKLVKSDRLNSAEKKAEAAKRLNNHKISDRIESLEYYVDVWSNVLRSLKFVSNRIGDAIIEDASEKKMLSYMRSSSSSPDSSPPSNVKNDVWRSEGPLPE